MRATNAFKAAPCALLILLINTASAGVFYREYWAQPDEQNLSNCSRWLRVNDTELSLHETFGKREEARANGLMLISVSEDLFLLNRAELYLEMWGGHPGTANKRFLPNGKETYSIPEVGAEPGNCTYSYPVIDLKARHLVTGINAFQFACGRGCSFWGHFIIDNACVRCYLKPEHPDLAKAGLEGFTASVRLHPSGKILDEVVDLSISCPQKLEQSVLSVDYFGRYLGFGDNGDGLENDWHGFTQKRRLRNRIGSASKPPFALKWDTSMVPSQTAPMAVRAIVDLKGEFYYITDALDGLAFAPDRDRVEMYRCSVMPVPFWSRNSQEETAVIKLPGDISSLRSAHLLLKIWDGGRGSVKEPFKINGHPYAVTSGRAVHDVVFTQAKVNPDHLRPGDNEITLISETEHHGIEVLLPGPVLIVRYARNK